MILYFFILFLNFKIKFLIFIKKFDLIQEYNYINSNKNSFAYNESSHNIIFSVYKEFKNNIKIALDIKGRLWYRRYVNEILPSGEDWSELKYFEGKLDEMRKFLDFDINLNNIYAVNPNSKVLIINNIDIPKLFDK